MAAESERRVELVGTAPEQGSRLQRIGVGLLVSLGIGFGPLRDAATGNGSFTQAMVRYLACLACSVLAVMTLGGLLDGAPPAETDEEPTKEDAALS